jgi:hypothetical protein
MTRLNLSQFDNATPGPWSDFGPGSPTIYGGDPIRRLLALDRQQGAPMDEMYATARLIAAAPALVAALRDAYAEIDRLREALRGCANLASCAPNDDEELAGREFTRIMQRARAALAQGDAP